MSWLEHIKSAFRDWAIDGIPASGDYEPEKSAIRAAFDELALSISSIGAGLLRFETKALLDADTTEPDGTLAYVYGDATAALNTVYQSTGGTWAEAVWYFDAVAEVVQPLVDEAEAAAATSQSLSDAFTRIPDQPNLFTEEQLAFNDLSIWTSNVPAIAEVRGERRCLKITNGSASTSFPASAFAETDLISASLWVEELQGATTLSRLRIAQFAEGDVFIGNAIVEFGTSDFSTPTFFELSAIPLDPSCARVDFVLQTASGGGGGTVWVRNLFLGQGGNAQYRPPSFAASFDERARVRQTKRQRMGGDTARCLLGPGKDCEPTPYRRRRPKRSAARNPRGRRTGRGGWPTIRRRSAC